MEFKLNFDVDILTFFWLGNCFGNFFKNWAIILQSSGHPEIKETVNLSSCPRSQGKYSYVHGQTLTKGQNQGYIFNSKCRLACLCHAIMVLTKTA
jgi:hypothetical protein